MTQYRVWAVLAVWAAAAVPMGVLAWVVVPAVASPADLMVGLIAAQAAGLIWQSVLVLILVARERHGLRWAVPREALWLWAPSDRSGRRGGRLWWWALPFVAGYGALSLVPLDAPGPSDRRFADFLTSAEGHDTLSGAWWLFALIVLMQLGNTVIGEELLFRGLLLPRMRGAFGRLDWIANGVLFGLYHLHLPWAIPSATVAGICLFAYPTRRFRSAWMGIVVHSAQSVVVVGLALVWTVR